MIAIDMTARPRHDGIAVSTLVQRVHEEDVLVLADISTYEEGMEAARIGADAISTTMSGYTPYSPQLAGPDLALVKRLSADAPVPVFAEGRIHTPEELQAVMAAGAYAPIIGSAITRPQLITAAFFKALGGEGK
jgi:N-acylglucosamine-6-phosphate 2-epimerase